MPKDAYDGYAYTIDGHVMSQVEVFQHLVGSGYSKEEAAAYIDELVVDYCRSQRLESKTCVSP